MEIDVVPTLIEQFRETFEGTVHPGRCWITDGPPESAVFGTVATLNSEEAFAVPVEGARSVAAHVAHLRFSLDLTSERLRGKNPAADWKSSFDVRDATAAGWEALNGDLRRAYDEVVTLLEARRAQPVQEWPPIILVGMAAITAHNAYHLGAIRQIASVVRRRA